MGAVEAFYKHTLSSCSKSNPIGYYKSKNFRKEKIAYFGSLYVEI